MLWRRCEKTRFLELGRRTGRLAWNCVHMLGSTFQKGAGNGSDKESRGGEADYYNETRLICLARTARASSASSVFILTQGVCP